MKKRFILFLAMIFILGFAGSVLAAANPFVDVPAKHWAYEAISKLAKDGIVDGYGDGAFRGDRTMTRYEMAQVVAKAMAYQGKVNAEQKAMIDKLAVEFSTELQNLGLRVSNVESKLNKMPKFNGEVRLQYRADSLSDITVLGTSYTPEQANQSFIDLGYSSPGFQKNTSAAYARLRLYLTGNINDNWTYNARFAAYADGRNGYNSATPSNGTSAPNSWNPTLTNGNTVMFDYGFVKGDYKNWKIYLGKFEDNLPFSASQGKDDGGFGVNQALGMLNDNWLTGVRIAYNTDKFKANVFYGADVSKASWDFDSNGDPVLVNYLTMPNVSNASQVLGADIGYALNSRLNLYYGYFQQMTRENAMAIEGITFTNLPQSISYNQFGFDYKFTHRFLFSGFIGGSNAATDNKAWTARLDYGLDGYLPDSTKQGSWSVYAFWQDLKRLSAWNPTYDTWNVYQLGGRGLTFGVNYVFIPNTMFNIEYTYLNVADNEYYALGSQLDASSANSSKIKVTLDYFF